METIVITVHVIAALAITALVLIQHGKGADMGASFGSGASQTIFGGSGSGRALSSATTWLAVTFFATSLFLAFVAKQQAGSSLQDSDLLQNRDQIETIVNSASAQADIPQAPASNSTSDVPELPVEVQEALQAAMDEANTAVQTAADSEQ